MGIPRLTGRGAVGHRGKAEKLAFLNKIDSRGGHPFAFVVARGHDAVGADAHAVRIAQADGKHFDIGAVFGHLQHRPAVIGGVAALGVVEVALGSVSRHVANSCPPGVTLQSLLKFS